MTTQLADMFDFQNRSYTVTHVSNGALFSPFDYQLQLKFAGTFCWRGYVCKFTVAHWQLILTRLSLNLNTDLPNTAKINGALPQVDNCADALFTHTYENLNLPINYSGGLLLSDEPSPDLAIHGGFSAAWEYDTTFELAFYQGKLIRSKDVSQYMVDRREWQKLNASRWLRLKHCRQRKQLRQKMQSPLEFRYDYFSD
ncbi:MAG: hypothetical protein H7A01_03600 [Hahellaceae bacterium]|nr:hypothetical protein [Hahellaceae bacterium]MCP5212269.1 hypothetical protein [Hahellaceae bacterium]